MPDFLAPVLEVPGLGWMLLTISVAGIVRGFTGFGTALMFVPVAGRFLPAADVILIITLTGIGSTLALLPKACREADKREVGVLAFCALLTVPFGIAAMQALPALQVRWAVAGIAGGTLIALVVGWRYRGTIGAVGLIAIGLAAGFIGGLTGMTGPVVILFYLAGTAAIQTVRANTILFLAALDVVIVSNLFLGGISSSTMIAVAFLLGIPYLCTTIIGQKLFDPRYEKSYRWVAYAVIGMAVISGVPVFD